jgi:hypothetical protein
LKHTMRRGLEDEIKMFRQLAECGLKLIGSNASSRRQWLEEMRDSYAFLEREFPALMERYEKQQAKKWVKTPPEEG